jgi:hypothetical protein
MSYPKRLALFVALLAISATALAGALWLRTSAVLHATPKAQIPSETTQQFREGLKIFTEGIDEEGQQQEILGEPEQPQGTEPEGQPAMDVQEL